MKAPRRAEVLGAIRDEAATLVRCVLKEADARRMAVYLVGGPVRDLLLDREVADVDLVVAERDGAGAADLARAAATADLRVSAHDRFGTVGVRQRPVPVIQSALELVEDLLALIRQIDVFFGVFRQVVEDCFTPIHEHFPVPLQHGAI